MPDTAAGIKSCSKLLKSGAPFLMYLYCNLENRPLLFRFVWAASDAVRGVVSVLPFRIKKVLTTVIALVVYYPLARLSLVLEKLGRNVDGIPLSDYRHKGLYFMKTDALDRFGTKLEKRFSRREIREMLEDAGFTKVVFSENAPYWVGIAYKK